MVLMLKKPGNIHDRNFQSKVHFKITLGFKPWSFTKLIKSESFQGMTLTRDIFLELLEKNVYSGNECKPPLSNNLWFISVFIVLGIRLYIYAVNLFAY